MNDISFLKGLIIPFIFVMVLIYPSILYFITRKFNFNKSGYSRSFFASIFSGIASFLVYFLFVWIFFDFVNTIDTNGTLFYIMNVIILLVIIFINSLIYKRTFQNNFTKSFLLAIVSNILFIIFLYLVDILIQSIFNVGGFF